MPPYIAFLRAINVGGHAVIKMADLRDLLTACGFEEVQTYIQTGNVVLHSRKRSPKAVQVELEGCLAAANVPTDVFVRSPGELARIAKANPFRPDDETTQSHVMLLDGRPDAARARRLGEMEGEEYRFHVDGEVLYYAYDKKWAGRRRTIDFEKVLGVRGTARTWKVIDKMVALVGPETSP